MRPDTVLENFPLYCPKCRQETLITVRQFHMSDAEIANVLNIVRRSVAYRRTSTLKLLKKLMGGENR